ncbi:MAG TPA: DUF3618 domain-containing protein [Gemmatimonadaceae bacterium]|nr:DUF3618 domain-containing protein [Gemmatimonadaceae bacterium]
MIDGDRLEQTRSAPDSTEAAKRDIEETRERMSGTIAELEQRVSGRIDDAKRKVNPMEHARQHPWPALTIAFAAGLALSATGADRKAAGATVRAAKRAPDATKRGVTQAVEATKSGVSHLAERLNGDSGNGSSGTSDTESSGGLVSKATSALRSQVRELGDDARRGVDGISGAAEPPNSART